MRCAASEMNDMLDKIICQIRYDQEIRSKDKIKRYDQEIIVQFKEKECVKE